tara:strand:- start:550 stop:780 length:231 start_codon:yes stop_codon:yes gene_type:complete
MSGGFVGGHGVKFLQTTQLNIPRRAKLNYCNQLYHYSNKKCATGQNIWRSLLGGNIRPSSGRLMLGNQPIAIHIYH